MSQYIRDGIFTIEEVFKLISRAREIQLDRIVINGHQVKVWSDRYSLFMTKGITCVRCGLVGTHFALERSKGNTENDSYHFNLYATINDGERLMTKDHIMPKCSGGKDVLMNYQTMCTRCNNRKGSRIPEKKIIKELRLNGAM